MNNSNGELECLTLQCVKGLIAQRKKSATDSQLRRASINNRTLRDYLLNLVVSVITI